MLYIEDNLEYHQANDFPMFILAPEGIWCINIDPVMLCHLSKDIGSVSEEKILLWKHEVIKKFDEINDRADSCLKLGLLHSIKYLKKEYINFGIFVNMIVY